MKITLHRNVKVLRYSVLATLQVYENRPDVVALLKKTVANPIGMPERLLAYLDYAGLWDKPSQLLTEQGQKLLDTQKMLSVERGIYSIWYTDQDELLGTRPILLKRVEASTLKNWDQHVPRHKAHALNLTLLKEIYIANPTGKALTFIQSVNVEVHKPVEQESVMQLQWELQLQPDQSLQSTVTLSGRLTLPSDKDKSQQSIVMDQPLVLHDVQPVDLDRLYADISHGNGQLWDTALSRSSTDLPNDASWSALDHFEMDYQLYTPLHTRDAGDFNRTELAQYPIMPRDAETASRWQSAWIEQAFKDKYYTLDEIARLQRVWCAHPAVSKYRLLPQDSASIMTQISRQRAPASFWHIAAIHDLTPTHTRPFQYPFTLDNNDAFLVDDFLKKMTLGHAIEYCIYVDRHFKDDNHVQNLRLIQDQLNAKKGIIMTSEPAPPHPPSDWEIKKIQKTADNHDRYWLLRSSEQWLCWKCSTSLDFFSRGPVSHRVKGTPTFTPMTIPKLPQFLQNELQGFRS